MKILNKLNGWQRIWLVSFTGHMLYALYGLRLWNWTPRPPSPDVENPFNLKPETYQDILIWDAKTILSTIGIFILIYVAGFVVVQ